jgi:hypothetical protein
MAWYLRSIGDRDTHRGAVLHPDGTVTAVCGIRFRPRDGGHEILNADGQVSER